MPATPAKPTTSHIKRGLRDVLAQWPAGQQVLLEGPAGVGKRTLAQKLPHLAIEISHTQTNATKPGQRRVRLHPFGVRELGLTCPTAFRTLLGRGGFPARLWGQATTAGPTAETTPPKAPHSRLQSGLADRVGRTLSIHHLANSAGVADQTVRRWLAQQQTALSGFSLSPLPSPTAGQRFRALKKDRKHYPYDWSIARGEQTQTEALVGAHLLAWVHAWHDLHGTKMTLAYFRDCDQREVDFVVLKGGKPRLLIQCDPAIGQINRDLRYLANKFPLAKAWHLSLDAPTHPEISKGVHLAHPLALLWALDDVHGLAQQNPYNDRSMG